MQKRRTFTIADVARSAGVSPATVSRYLSQAESVHQDRRKRIQEAIQQLGYFPHGAARALASRRSRMIGAVFPRLDSLLFGSFFGPLQQCLSQAGYTLVVSSTEYDQENERSQLERLVSNSIDAVVLVGSQHSQQTFELLERAGLPYVLTWSWQADSPHPHIGFCNATAAGLAAGYLLDIGHTRLAMISGLCDFNDRAVARVQGVRQTLREHGLTLRDSDVVERDFSVSAGAEAFRSLMQQTHPPTAIVCGSDMFAFGAIFEAQRLGIRVPEDVSITGFDDTTLAQNIYPALTTIRTPRLEMAKRSAAFLLEALSSEQPAIARTQHLPVELVIRNSTAPIHARTRKVLPAEFGD